MDDVFKVFQCDFNSSNWIEKSHFYILFSIYYIAAESQQLDPKKGGTYDYENGTHASSISRNSGSNSKGWKILGRFSTSGMQELSSSIYGNGLGICAKAGCKSGFRDGTMESKIWIMGSKGSQRNCGYR